jgi:hypothetical protein
MQVSDRPVSKWLASLDDPRAEDVRALDALIAEVFAGDTRVMWEGVFWGGTEQSIIDYGNLEQARPRGETVHWFVAGLALQKSGISVYVNAVKDGQYLGRWYGMRLGKVKIGSASIGFKRLTDLDIAEFIAMIREARQLTSC